MGVRSVGIGAGILGEEDILLNKNAGAILFCKGERSFFWGQSCSITFGYVPCIYTDIWYLREIRL